MSSLQQFWVGLSKGIVNSWSYGKEKTLLFGMVLGIEFSQLRNVMH